MNAWKIWKQSFDSWEKHTASYLESMMKKPALLQASGSMLSASMKTKAATDKAMASWWGGIGLPTKRDQERGLHKLNQLESKILDLEERLEDLER